MKLINVFLSFILKFFHILFTIIAFVGPLVTNNVLVLAFLFAVNASVIFCFFMLYFGFFIFLYFFKMSSGGR